MTFNITQTRSLLRITHHVKTSFTRRITEIDTNVDDSYAINVFSIEQF
jgi:hypothetical protein